GIVAPGLRAPRGPAPRRHAPRRRGGRHLPRGVAQVSAGPLALLRIPRAPAAEGPRGRRARAARRQPRAHARRRAPLRAAGKSLRAIGAPARAASRPGRGLLPPRQPRRRRGPARDRGEADARQRFLRALDRRIAAARAALAAGDRARRREGAQDQLMRRATTAAASLAVAAAFAAAGEQPAGSELFVRPDKGDCLACHRLPDGAGPATRADLGPRLDGERMRGLGRERLRALLVDPMQANPETLMPPFGRHHLLEAGEIQRIVDYLLALPAAAPAAAED